MAKPNRLDPIPHPPKKPVIGNVLTVDGKAPIQDLMRLAKEHGPIFWLDMIGTPLVVVSGFDLVDEICDEKRFDKAVRGSLRRIRSFAGDGLFTADTSEANWSKAHHILLPTFGHRAMQTYHPRMLDIANQLCLKWERLNADDDIDVVHDMTALTLDTIGLCGFDYRFNSFYRQDNHPYVEAMVRSLETIMKLRGLPLEDLLTRNRQIQLKADVAFMNGMVDKIVKDRRESGDTSTNDLLGYMLSGNDKTTGERLDDVNIRYQINTFLIAGHETTSGMLSFAIYFLLNYPEVLAKAYAEVDRVLGDDLSAQPTYAQVNQLVYISQILKEALRLWPTAPAIGLYPYKDEVIGGKYRLKKGTFITLLSLMLHRDKSVWGPNPEVFNPDNFSREAERARPANAYKPFGNGQRACIGRQFAMQEAALVIGMILQRFKLIDHTRYQLKVKETLTLKPDGFTIRVRPRTDRDRTQAPRPVVVSSPPTQPAVAPAVAAKHGTPLLVLFGSNLGTSEEIARDIAEAGEANGFATTLASLDERVGDLPTEGATIIVTGSYNGAPPDNAAQFMKWLGADLAPDALAGVKFTVFGCGNSDWAATYQSVPRVIDDLMAAAGARRILDRGEGDAREDLDGQFQAWYGAFWPTIARELGVDVEVKDAATDPLYEVEEVAQGDANSVARTAGAVPMRVLENRELQRRDGASPSERSTRHIEIALPQGMTYRVGDHLSVVPRNHTDLVDRAMQRFGFAPDAHVRLRAPAGRRAALPVGEAVSVRRLLSEHVELQSVATRRQVAMLADVTECPMTKPKLAALGADASGGTDAYRSEVFAKRKSVLDLLEEYPACQPPFGVFLEMLPLMTPRYYSISSSPAVDAGRCSITVGVVEGPARSGRGTFRGICSNHLLDHGADTTVDATVKETKAGFQLPADPSKSIIMIGPGTGLAPFRGFLHERAALKQQGRALGPAMLFFGCRHPDQDFIYADELKRFADDGVVDLHVAFSRHDGQKTYVQDLIAREQNRVWQLIEGGAVVYVCGDGSRMEPDVKRALIAIHSRKTGEEESKSAAWINDLGLQNRYVLDVWAAA